MVSKFDRKALLAGVSLAILLLFWIGAPRASDGWAEGGAPNGPEGAAKPIRVSLTTHLGDGQRFLQGDTIAFFLSLDAEAHILAVYEDAERRRIQILPNRNQPESHYPSGLYQPIPGEGAGFQFRVTPPFGRERLWVFATEGPLPVIDGEPLVNGLKRLSADVAAIRRRLKAQAGGAYGEACLEILTQAAD